MVHTIKQVKNYKINWEIYQSVNEFLTTQDSRERLRNDFERGSKDKSFTLVNNYDEARELITSGYKEALSSFNELLKDKVYGKKSKIVFKNDRVGFIPIVPNVLLGIPNNMINSKIIHQKTPVLDIHYDPRFCCGVNAKHFIEVGKKILDAIFTLEKMGTKVNLYYTNFESEDDDLNDIDVCTLKIKDSGRPLDINRITFPMAHPAMLRVFAFEWMSKVPNGTYRSGYGQGFYKLYNKETRNMITKSVLGANAIYIAAEQIENLEVDEIIKLLREV